MSPQMSPAIRLKAHVSPTTIPVVPTDYIATVRLDVITPGLHEGAVARPLNLALVFDKSGSMGSPMSKIQTAREAAARVVDHLSDSDTFCLVSFSETHDVLVPACRVGGNRDAIKAAIGKLVPETTTNLKSALEAAAAHLRPHMKEGVLTSIYALTDGVVADADASIQAASQLIASGMDLRAGGLGADWKIAFLDRFTGDPKKVIPLTLENLPQMIDEFEQYVKRKGHVITSKCRLSFEVPARRLRVKAVIADRLGDRKLLPLDANNTTLLTNLPAGTTADYAVELVVAPGGARDIPATFRVHYDLPAAGLFNQVAETTADIRVVENAEMKINDVVEQTLLNIREVRTAEKIEEAIKNNEKGRATGMLDNLEGLLRKTGRLVEADKAAEMKKELEKSHVADSEAMQQTARGLTGRLNRPAN